MVNFWAQVKLWGAIGQSCQWTHQFVHVAGVYDITKFVHNHPGGDKILMAAGGSVEPFWLMYAVHNTPETLALLEQHRIGKVIRQG
jgi:cytochrome b involved in lipid metabolism